MNLLENIYGSFHNNKSLKMECSIGL